MSANALRVALAIAATSVLAASHARAAWLDDQERSRRGPELLVTLWPELDPAPAERETFYPRLSALTFYNVQSGIVDDVKLYDVFGSVDPAAAERLDDLLADARDPSSPRTTHLDRRLLMLVFRAAYHFKSQDVTVISGYRDPGRSIEGKHGEGKAIDFQLRKVPAAALAAYLRKSPRAGVGVYTNRRTQYVHLDMRDRSFHWLDASPPGVRWPEQALGLAGLTQQDDAYACADDWPEGPLPRAARECESPASE
jgi:uncharacterized protein YcbK (DUF882 family)